MGQQQLLLIVLGVIIVGVAIVAGIGLFNAGAEESAKDELVSQCVTIGSNAQQFYRRPVAMGGGGNTFDNYVIPEKMSYTANGTYDHSGDGQQIIITATPIPEIYSGEWSVQTTVNPDTLWTEILGGTTP